ncbi:MAG: ABC transporter substrate-binding protein [Oscillospiraceae bacterium]
MANKPSKLILLVLAASLLCGVFSACSKTENEEPPLPSGILETPKVASASQGVDKAFSLNCNKAESFNPFTSNNNPNLLCAQLMYDNIFELDESFVPSSAIISDFKSEDGKAWSFTLNPNIKFWDGSPLTAQDVVYSLQRAMQSPRFSPRLRAVIGLSALDESSFALNLYTANTQFPALLSIPIIKSGSSDQLIPMGTGPYFPAEGLYELKAFDGHRDFASLPVDSIELKEYKAAEDLITAFENSEIDLVTNDPNGFQNLGYGASNEIRSYATTNMHYLGFNSKSSFFSNPLCRRAMTYVIDRESIVSNDMNAAASAAALPMHPASSLYNSSYSALISYSEKKSEDAFDLAEVQDYDDDGAREIMITGIPVEIDINFIVCNSSPIKVAAARQIAKNMSNIGINVNLRELPWDSYESALNAGKFDMYYAETKLTADFSLRELLAWNGKLNYGKFTDAALETCIADYLAAPENELQYKADLMFKYVTDTAPIVPICFEKQQVITHRGVISGLKPTQYNIFQGIKDWKITTAE